MTIMPLMNDGLDGAPAKRVLNSMQAQKEKGRRIVGIYCGYAPIELIQAMDLVPAVLCAFADLPIASAEAILPANLCPLIKSSYGYILEGTCPFFGLAEAVIAETTCDGKKKMFELAAEVKPMHVMDLPQLPDEMEALANWTAMIRKLQAFLEATFDRKVDNQAIEASIKASNRKNRLVRRIFDYAALHPPVLSRQEMYDVAFLALPARGEEIAPLLETLLARLAARREKGECFGSEDSPRVLVTGSPVGGDALKIFRIIEEAGGVVVTPDACTGIKSFIGEIDEDTDDPVAAIARRYLAIPCACMTPNSRRLTALSELIDRFRPDAVVDFILTACHSYNVESYKIGRHVGEHHGLPYLKIESNYSKSDEEQIRTKIEALFEIAGS